MGNVIIKLSLQYYYNKAICTIIARILVTVNLYLIRLAEWSVQTSIQGGKTDLNVSNIEYE